MAQTADRATESFKDTTTNDGDGDQVTLPSSASATCTEVAKSSILVFISRNSGNKVIECNQQRIFTILRSLGIDFQTVDISAPGTDDERRFMRQSAKKRDERMRNCLPPQIFNDSQYRGDYEDFDIANEDDTLEEFLGIPRRLPKCADKILSPPNESETDSKLSPPSSSDQARERLQANPAGEESVTNNEQPTLTSDNTGEEPVEDVEPLPEDDDLEYEDEHYEEEDGDGEKHE